ncbi:MAG: glycosyltransferase family 2 protein [Actinobacteria bacterium]|nr:glycosyltransferase family 2 protein [Actinomycetota bacterium]
MRSLDVVIVSYRCRELLERCLRSLDRHPFTHGEMRVHVVDNASGDGTAELVERRFPHVRLQRLERNVGFSVANNAVLRHADGDAVLLLNPDTEMTAGALDALALRLAARPDVGMLGCRLVLDDGSFDHAAKRSFPTPLSALAHFAGVGRRAGADRRLAQYRAPQLGEHDSGEVDAVNGAFMLVRREALDDVGLLDERYWLYMEDLDWCYRFHQRGWRVWYEGGVTVVHVKGGTSGRHRRLRQNVAFHRGMARFYRKFHAGRNPLLDGAVLVGIGAKLALAVSRSALARALAPRARQARA